MSLDEDEAERFSKYESKAWGETHRPGNPLRLDLSSNSTVWALLKLGMRRFNEVLRSVCDTGFDPANDDVEPIMQHLGMLFACDGAPAIAMSIMKEAYGKLAGHTDLQQASVHAGGFHNMLKFLNMRGKLWAKIHLNTFVGLWRGKDGQECSQERANWVIHPGNPTQALIENLEYLYAHYVTAAWYAAQHHRETKCTEDFTAEYVNKYMIRRAREEPLV